MLSRRSGRENFHSSFAILGKVCCRRRERLQRLDYILYSSTRTVQVGCILWLDALPSSTVAFVRAKRSITQVKSNRASFGGEGRSLSV